MVTRKQVFWAVLSAGAAITVGIIGCGKKSSSDDAAAETTDPVVSNPASLAYPSSLAITSFPSTTSATLTLTDPSDSTGAAKKSEQDKILSGSADSCMPK